MTKIRYLVSRKLKYPSPGTLNNGNPYYHSHNPGSSHCLHMKKKKFKPFKCIVLPILSYLFEKGELRKTSKQEARQKQEDEHVNSAKFHHIFGKNWETQEKQTPFHSENLKGRANLIDLGTGTRVLSKQISKYGVRMHQRGSFDSEQVPKVGNNYYCTNIKLKIKVTMKEKIKIYRFHGSDY